MNFNYPIKSTVPLPKQEGMLITYFKTNQGLEFIEAVKLHLEGEDNTFDYFGAIQAGVNKAVENGSIVVLYLITLIRRPPQILYNIQIESCSSIIIRNCIF